MSDLTQVGTVGLGVEILPGDFETQLRQMGEQIGASLKGSFDKVGKSLSESVKGAFAGDKDIVKLSERLQSAMTKSVEKVGERYGKIFDVLEDRLSQLFMGLERSVEELLAKLNAGTARVTDGANVKAGTLNAKMTVPRGPPLKVDLDTETQLNQLLDQLSLVDEKWEMVEGKVRKNYEAVEALEGKMRDLTENAAQFDGVKFVDKDVLGQVEDDLYKARAAAAKSREELLGLEHTGERIRQKIAEIRAETEKTEESAERAATKQRGFFGRIWDKVAGLPRAFGRAAAGAAGLGVATEVAGRRGGKALGFLSGSLLQVSKRIFILQTIARAIRALMAWIGGAARASAGYSAALAQVKQNLATAFQPILNVIVPALNAFMHALAAVTGAIAKFMAALFGTTYEVSLKQAQATKAAVDGYKGIGSAAGGAAKKAKKAAKEIKGSLAGFDEINTLNIPDDTDDSGGGGGGGGIGDMVTEAEASLGSSKLLDKIKELWTTLSNTESFKKLEASAKKAFSVISEHADKAAKRITKSWQENSPRILKAWQDLGLEIGKAAVNWTAYISTPLVSGAVGAAMDFGAALIDGLLTIGADISELAKEIFAPIFAGFNNFMDEYGPQISDAFYAFWEMVGTDISRIIDGVFNIFHQVFGGIIEWFREHSPEIEELWTKTWTTAWDIIRPIWQIISDVAHTVFEGIAYLLETIAPTIRDAVVGTWDAIWKIIKPLWESILNAAQKIFGGLEAFWNKWGDTILTLFKGVWEVLVNVFDASLTVVGGLVQNAFAFIGTLVESLMKIFDGLINFITAVFTGDWAAAWEAVKDIVNGIWEGIKNIIKGGVNYFIGEINAFIRGINKIKIPDWVPLVGGKGFHIPEIPMLARGGVLDEPTLAMVGEAGKEAVVPLEHNTQGLDLLAEKLLARMPQQVSGGGGDLTVVLKLDGREVSKAVIKDYNKQARQTGKPLLGGGR